MGPSLGLQLYSVRNALKQDPVGTLEKVAAIGYRDVELAIHYSEAKGEGGYTVGGLGASELRECFDRLGLRPRNAQLFPIENVKWKPLVEFAKEIGMPAVSISMYMFKNKQAVLDFAAMLNECGEFCRTNGLDFYYHNHFQEFQVFDGKYVMDYILELTDPNFLKVEFDTYWALRGGVDPCEYLRRLGDRCDYVHQKDMPASADPVNWFDHYGHDTEITLEMKLATSTVDQFIEIGDGVMDIPAIIRTVREMGVVKTIFVEQDFTYLDEMESVTKSRTKMLELLNNGEGTEE